MYFWEVCCFVFMEWLCSALLQTESPGDVDIDLDEILDIEDDRQRKKFVCVSLLSIPAYNSDKRDA